MISRARITKLVKTPPCDWERVVGNRRDRKDAEWEEIANALESDGIRMLLLAEYIEARKGGYCGDHKTHEDAAKMVKSRHLKLRRALGFTVPTAGLLNLGA